VKKIRCPRPLSCVSTLDSTNLKSQIEKNPYQLDYLSEMKQPGEDFPSGFVGRSPKIAQIRTQLEKLAPRRSPVLIQGESGTGKEVAARTLFNGAPRGQFVPIDCGSLVGTMMESELFGHVRGAFTGAVDAKRGLIDLANGGTAFFDEIGELPLEMQVKLLRVLQEQELRPVGSLQRVKIDVRVVAATNRDLEREVTAGRFREDLFHRLNVVRLILPPLREHKEDIPLLIEGTLAHVPGRYIISNDAMDAISAYHWPGNVRELKNCLERMMAFNSGPLLHFADLPSNVANYSRTSRSATDLAAAATAIGAGMPFTPEPGGLRSPVFGHEMVVPLQELERRAIQHALEHTHGDRTVAAQLLGIGRTTLYRKLKEFEIA
jgi:DNA-binding NtrC family response regulator